MIKLRVERGCRSYPRRRDFRLASTRLRSRLRTDHTSRLRGADGPIGLGRNSEQGAARAADYPFGGASAKQVEQAGMSFSRHHDQIHIEFRSCR